MKVTKMINNQTIGKMNLVTSVRNFINWRLLKQKICDKLTMFPTQQLMLETYVIDKNGKVRDHKKGKAHSYTIQWLQHIEVMSNHSYGVNGGTVYIRNSSNVLEAEFCSQAQNGNFGFAAPSTNTNYGILVGTGTTAVACSDYKMQTLIANGSASGQLNYSATVVIGATNAGTTCSLAVTRAVSNASGADVTIQEIGLMCETYMQNGLTYYLLIHDLATQTLHNGDTYLIIYTMQTSISS